MKKELLLASVTSLLALNQGKVEAAVPFNVPITVTGSSAPPPATILTISENGVPCTGNPVNYSGPAAINTAFKAIRSDFSKPYDLQICPSPTSSVTGSITGTTLTVTAGTINVGQVITGNGVSTRPTTFVTGTGAAAGTYTISPTQTVAAEVMTATTPYSSLGYAVFNGTIEGMGSAQYGQDVTILENCPGCQAYMLVGDATAPYPGVTLEVKNLQIDGTTNGNPAKGARAVQVIAGGFTRFDNDSFINNQDGILSDRWTEEAQDGAGTIVVSGSYFDNNCSANGPSHNLYLLQGVDIVGAGTATVVGGIPTVGTGTVLGINVVGNSFGACQYGYGTKVRPTRMAFVEGNTYHMNFANLVPSSGAIQDGEGATLVATGNYIALGPFTGTNAQPPQVASFGGELGENDPQSYTFANNDIVLQGVTNLVTIVANLNQTTNLQIANNTLPLKNQIIAAGPLVGLGTIGAGNVYADSSSVTPVVQNSAFYNMTVPAGYDYRGTSGAKTANLSGINHMSWGGNGALTANIAGGSGNLSSAVIGGPGGAIVNGNTGVTNLWLFTNPTAPNDTITLGGDSTYQLYLYGTNEILNFSTKACPNQLSPVNVFQGATVTINYTQPQIVDCAIYNAGGVANLNIAPGATASSTIAFVWPNGTIDENGTDGYTDWYAQNGTLIANSITTTGTNAATYTFEIDGGWINSNPNPAGGFRIATYDNGPGGVGVIKLQGSIQQSYTINAAGGATVYPGVNQFSVAGPTRNLGPPALPITAHVQSTPSTSSINSAFGALNLYLDGPGTLKANSANNNTQPTYIEVDTAGSGHLELQRLWSPTRDSCLIAAGVTTVTSGRVGSNWVMTFSNGGTVQFDGATTVSCSGGHGGTQSLSSISMSCGSSCTVAAGAIAAPVGTAVAGLLPTSPAFSGTWAITNTGSSSAGVPCNAAGSADFTIGSSSGAITTATSLTAGAVQNVCVTATQGGLTGSPLTQAFTFTAVAPSAFYVATNGNDTWSGTLPAPNGGSTDGPFLTLTKAQSAMQASGSIKTTYVRSGSYAPASIPNCDGGGGTCGLNLGSSDNGETWSYYPPDGYGTASITGGSGGTGTGLDYVIYVGTTGGTTTINGLQIHNFQFAGIGSTGGVIGLLVENNTVHDGFKASGFSNNAGVQCYGCLNTTFSHNWIYNMQSAAMSVVNVNSQNGTINNLKITGNASYNTCTATSDCGAIYIQDPSATSTGLQVINNYVRDGNTFATLGSGGGEGLYADDCASNLVLSGNVVTGRSGSNTILVHGGSNVTVTTNVVDLTTFQQNVAVWQTSDLSGCSAGTMSGNTFQSNVVVGGGGGGGYNLLSGSPLHAPSISNNAYWNYAGAPISHTGSYTDTNPTTENPAFSTATWFYTLTGGSPVTNPPVNFPPLVGGWGPPGFTIPNEGTQPSYIP